MTPHKKRADLQGLEKVTEFIRICLNSASIKGERPLSLVIVAPVSSGKTTSIKQFKNNKNILITTDSTAYGILKNYQNSLKNGEISYVFVPDLLNLLARKKQTADQMLLFINASSEDGIFPSKTYGSDVSEYIPPFGWVLCVTEDGWKKKKKFLDGIGFISRFFVIKYKYSLEQINLILKNIIEEKSLNIPNIEIKNLKNKKEIIGDKEIFERATVYSRLLSNNGEAEVLRMQKKIQVFLKASAFSRGDNKVKEQDLKKLEELIDLIK